jgi:hypothetical protein
MEEMYTSLDLCGAGDSRSSRKTGRKVKMDGNLGEPMI